MNGLIQVYLGNGKGKTTAAFGLGLRASGHGLNVLLIQFMKTGNDSAIKQIKKLPNYEVKCFGTDKLLNKPEINEKDLKLINKGFKVAYEETMSSEFDLVILDEINTAIDFDLIDLGDVIDFLEKKPSDVEVVLTGRGAPEELIEVADLVTDMQKIKHYFDKGTKARKGIDF